MNELVQLVQQKTGLSQDVAENVVNTILGYIKGKLPAGMASGLDELIGGDASDEGGFADKAKAMMAGLGGVLGNKEG